MRLNSRFKNIYYGWWVLLGSTLLAVVSGGILNHGASVFFIPIRRDLNLSSANTSIIFTVSRAQASLGGPLFGWLADKYGGRPLIIIGGLLAGFGFILIQRIESYIPFLLVYVLIVATGANVGFGQTLLTIVNRWFVRRKAIALTILLTGFAAGGAIFVFPLGIGVDTIGWRPTLLYAGIFVLGASLLLSFVIRHSPERMGIPVEGTEENEDEEQPMQAQPADSPVVARTGEVYQDSDD